MGDFMIREATLQDVEEAAQLAFMLWTNHALEDFRKEMNQLVSQHDSTVFLAFYNDEAVGFAQCGLRYDYVEGTSSTPVGYLEGLFVKGEFRKRGIARRLVDACENWSGSKKCREFASDCEIDNEESLATHIKLGFTEVNRIICFTKKL